MSIILSWSRWLFRSFFWELIFCDDCGRNCWFCLIHSDINVIGSNWRIWIWFPFIFSANRHIVLVIAEFFQMTIILSRSWRLFKWPLNILVFSNNSWRNSRFCQCSCLINIICSDWRIGIWFPYIFSSYCHIVCIETKLF